MLNFVTQHIFGGATHPKLTLI